MIDMGVTATPLERLKGKQHQIWSSGDYNRIAALTVPVCEALVAAAELPAGARVLDVAGGTGHVALAAARGFCRATALDYVPALLEVAGRRAAAEDLALDIVEGDAEHLPFPEASFDAVLSALGVMFTADHSRAAAELVRVCRPGGRIALANWTPTGFVGQMLRTVGAHVPPPAVATPPIRWGDQQYVADLLAEAATDLHAETRTVSGRFISAEHFADYFLTHYGPTRKASDALPPAGQAALRNDLVQLARTANRAVDGTCVLDWEYLLLVATRR
jgi:SAM-dependent methyltransferase